jgi:hypothetical protein
MEVKTVEALVCGAKKKKGRRSHLCANTEAVHPIRSQFTPINRAEASMVPSWKTEEAKLYELEREEQGAFQVLCLLDLPVLKNDWIDKDWEQDDGDKAQQGEEEDGEGWGCAEQRRN